jgi:hypothetical protein
MKSILPFICLLAFSMMTSSNMAAEPPPISIEGSWQCGPYTMKTTKFTATGSNTVTYRRNGEYSDLSITIITAADGAKTTLNTQTTGTWSQSDGVLQTKSNTVQVLSSDNPRYTVDMAQRVANEQQAKQDTAKNRVRVRSNSMTLRPVNPAIKEADINVVCRRL